MRPGSSNAGEGFDDLGAAYGYVFRALAEGEPSQRELARGLHITDQGMAKIIAEMIERGYVARRADREDARVNRLRLAPRGQAALGFDGASVITISADASSIGR